MNFIIENFRQKFSPCSALQCKKVQSSIEKFHGSKKLRKTENLSLYLNTTVPLESISHFCISIRNR